MIKIGKLCGVSDVAVLNWIKDAAKDTKLLNPKSDSGVVNDANLYATETMNDASYPLFLLMRIITVSLETMKIVNNLPKLDID